MAALPSLLRVPLIPRHTILTDRDDGSLWVLSHSEDGYRVSLRSIDEALPVNREWWDAYVYPVNEGPALTKVPGVFLIVRGGRLGYDAPGLSMGVVSKRKRRLLTRRGMSQRTYEIVKPTETPWKLFDALAWVVAQDIQE